jgi:hypothetical protein
MLDAHCLLFIALTIHGTVPYSFLYSIYILPILEGRKANALDSSNPVQNLCSSERLPLSAMPKTKSEHALRHPASDGTVGRQVRKNIKLRLNGVYTGVAYMNAIH